MSRTNPFAIAGFLAAVIAAYALATLAKGALFVGNYEGDTAHLLDLSMRLASGQMPHADYTSPLGVLSYAPIALFLKMGQGAGHAIMLSQILVAVALAPAIWWACYSRMRGFAAYFMALYCAVLVLALSQGQSATHISMAMHYNRWAWAIAYVVVIVSVLPPLGRRNAVADGAVIGLGMAVLALCKMTYFAALAPPVALALIARREFGAISVAALAAGGVAAGATFWLGVAYWEGYVADLRFVAASDVRPYPNKPFLDMLRLPNFIGSTLLIFAAVVFLRQSGRQFAGLILLALAPAFFYITFQNFGNDPQWLVLATVLVVLNRPETGVQNSFGWDLRYALSLVAAGLAAFASPAAVNMAYSPKVHFGADREDYSVFLPTMPVHGDLLAKTKNSYELKANIRLQVPDTAPDVAARVPEQDETTLNGETLPPCELYNGAIGAFRSIAEEIENAGLAGGKTLLVTDIINVIWMFGDFEPLHQGAPWYYGGAPGFQNADYVVVPMCPYRVSERHRILEHIADQGFELVELYRSSAVIVLRAQRI